MSDDNVEFAPGAIIFNEGDAADFMYIVKQGEVEIHIHNKPIVVLKKDDFFGEMAMIDQEPRSATAIAKTQCILAPVNQRRFAFMVQQTPFFALRLLKTMSQRVRQFNQTL